MKLRKAVCRGMAGIVIVVGMSLCASSAHASFLAPTDVKWTLTNFTFCATCGGTATGFLEIVYGPDESKTVTDFSITVDDSKYDTTFTPANSGVTLTGDPIFDVLQNDPFEFNFTVNTLDPDSSIATVLGGYFTDNAGFTCDLTGGTLDPTAVPEPASLALAASGILLLLGMSWRRRVLAR